MNIEKYREMTYALKNYLTIIEVEQDKAERREKKYKSEAEKLEAAFDMGLITEDEWGEVDSRAMRYWRIAEELEDCVYNINISINTLNNVIYHLTEEK